MSLIDKNVDLWSQICPHSKNTIVVVPVVDSFNVFCLLFVHALSDLVIIKVQASLFHLFVEILVKLFYGPPILVSDEVSLCGLASLVNDLGPAMITALEASNETVSKQPHSELDYTVDIIP